MAESGRLSSKAGEVGGLLKLEGECGERMAPRQVGDGRLRPPSHPPLTQVCTTECLVFLLIDFACGTALWGAVP